MIEAVASPAPEALAVFDDVIDVRSPSEFAQDRLPGAVNLPVLCDGERARVGVIYKQTSKFLARRVGAALVARNVARHLDEALAAKPAQWRPLVYCWRGGMRSNAMATILSQVGWRVGVLSGGYRTWRRDVVAALGADGPLFPFIAIDGPTGVGKTEILRALAARGAQTIDLEALALHRGSVFGAAQCAAQPPQKMFESALFSAMRALDPQRAIFVEAESSTIGRIALPARVWRSLRAAPRLRFDAPTGSRARYLTRMYGDDIAQEGFLDAALSRLAPFHAKATIAEWRMLAEARAFPALAESLIRAHYDPAYARSAKSAAPAVAAFVLGDLGPDDIARAAERALAVNDARLPRI